MNYKKMLGSMKMLVVAIVFFLLYRLLIMIPFDPTNSEFGIALRDFLIWLIVLFAVNKIKVDENGND